MQAQIKADSVAKPVALKIVIAFFFIFSLLFCGVVVIPHLLAHEHSMDLIGDPIVLFGLFYVGFGLLKLSNSRRIWAMYFFAMNALMSGLTAYEISVGGMRSYELFQIAIPTYAQVTFDSLVCTASIWSFWILTRRNIRELFSAKAGPGILAK
jgi:hypothetical protein